MPSLLDLLGKTSDAVLGTVPNVYSGLLSEDELRAAKSRAQSDALANMANAFYAAGEKGTGTGRALLQGLSAGRGGFDEALKGQVQEKMNQQKIQQALQGQKRAAEAQSLLSGAFQPAQPANVPMMNGVQAQGPVMPATPAQFNLESIAPQLMQTAEGRAALADVIGAQKAMRPEMFTLAEGAKQFARDASGNVVEVAAGAPKQTKIDLSSSFADAVDRLGLERKKANQYTEQELALINAKAKEIDKAKKAETTIKPPSDAQILAGGFADRMTAAQALTSALESQAPVGVMESIYGAIPLIGNKIPQVLPETLGGLGPERRQYLQAANNWIRANLRKESGAAIGADEWTEEYVNYFPQPGDDGDTIKQKAMFREITTQNMARAAGREYSPSVPASIAKKTKDLYSQYGLTPREVR